MVVPVVTILQLFRLNNGELHYLNSLNSLANNRTKEMAQSPELIQETSDKMNEELEVSLTKEELTLNVFELLSCDLQLYILTFLSVQDLYHVSLSCQHGAYLVLSPDNDGYLWKLVANQIGLNIDDEEAVIAAQELLSKKEEVEENQLDLSTLSLDVETVSEDSTLENLWRNRVQLNLVKWEPDTRTPDTDITMHNNNKTILCEKKHKWNTIRTNRKLELGRVHCWEYTLDEHDNGGYNAYRVFVGIERSTYEFTKAERDKIVGLCSEGVGYNMGEHTVSINRSLNPSPSVLGQQNFVFSSGDTIAMKFDLKNLCDNSSTASMHLFKNNEYFHTITGVPTRDIVYYPAISVIGLQKVSIRLLHPSMLQIPRLHSR